MTKTIQSFSSYEEIIKETALYPDVGQGTKSALSYTALGLCGESGEYAEKIKKYLRGQELDTVLAAKELGDVLWYITAAAHELGYCLQDIAELNALKLLLRKNTGTILGNGDTREVSKEQS